MTVTPRALPAPGPSEVVPLPPRRPTIPGVTARGRRVPSGKTGDPRADREARAAREAARRAREASP